MLYATVRQRKIYVKKPTTVIQNGVGVDELVLDMDMEWSNMTSIVCVFTLKYTETTSEETSTDGGETTTTTTTVTNEITKEMLHTFGENILVPWECLTKTGLLSVSCTGYVGSTKVMTTMLPDSFWNVVQNGPVTGDTPMEPTPTLYQQVLAAAGAANTAAEAANQARAALLADKENGVFDGVSPTVEVGSVTTGAAGSDAKVTNSGTAQAVKLDFVIPRGPSGPTGAPGRDGENGAGKLSELEEDSGHRTVTDAEKQAWNAKSDFSGSFFELKDYPEYGVVSYVGYAGGTVTIIGCQEDGSRQIYGYDILPNTNTAADGAFLRARNGSVAWETLTNVAEEGA